MGNLYLIILDGIFGKMKEVRVREFSGIILLRIMF